MSRNRKLGIVIWAIAFALSVFLTLNIPAHYSSNIFAVLTFDVIAFISVLILWRNRLKNTKTSGDTFYDSPAMTISTAYLVIQLILCITVRLMVDTISFKMTLILNVVLMAVVWFLILSTIIGLFKGKEKKALKVQIDDYERKLKELTTYMKPSVEVIQGKIVKAKKRICEIDAEFTKDRV